MTDWFEHDRNMGAGLPSTVNTGRLARLMAERHLPRVASVTQAMSQGFEPVDGQPGLFRRGHALWNVRAAEDGNGYVIIRLRDEPAPGIEPRRAQHIEVQVHLDEEEEPIALEGPPVPSMTPQPREDTVLIPLGEVHVATERYDPPTSMKHDTDIGELVEVTAAFSPLLYGGELVIPEGRQFTVTGQHAGTPEADQIAAPDLSNPVYPERGDHPGDFIRLGLKDDETGVEIKVLPLEFERFIRARGVYPKAPIQPYRLPRPRVGPDADVPNIDTMQTQDLGGRGDETVVIPRRAV